LVELIVFVLSGQDGDLEPSVEKGCQNGWAKVSIRLCSNTLAYLMRIELEEKLTPVIATFGDIL